MRSNYIHEGTLHQELDRILMSFNEKKDPVLVTTEAAAVGFLGIPNIKWYIGFDIGKGETRWICKTGYNFMLRALPNYPLIWLVSADEDDSLMLEQRPRQG